LPKPAAAMLVILVSMSGCGKTPSAASTIPAAVATPTPAPTPTPVPLGQGLACGLPVKAECGQTVGSPGGDPPGVYGCCTREPREVGQFKAIVSDAIYKLQAEQPSLFNGDQVLDRVAYQAGVARILERDYKVCAKPGLPGDEVAVKNTNDWSEQYDIYQSNARTFNPPGYGVTCRPARF